MSKPTWQKLAEDGNSSTGQAYLGKQWDTNDGPMMRPVAIKLPATFGQKVFHYGTSYLGGACMGFFVGGSVGALHCFMTKQPMSIYKKVVFQAGFPFSVIFGVGSLMRAENLE